MKVAIVHYWLVGMRGGERVLEELCALYPQAVIITHVLDKAAISDKLRQHEIRVTFINCLPNARKHYQKYLPLMPYALEMVDMSEFDLILSSESGPAKGVICRPDAVHVCYCHSPMRYIWDHFNIYRASAGRITQLAMPIIAHKLRIWDVTSAARVDHFIANSRFVAQRVHSYYRRDSQVIPPPVAVEAFQIAPAGEVGSHYLMAGELVQYKRPDLAIEAFTRNGLALRVIGGGERLQSLRKTAGPNITFLGKVPFDQLKSEFSRCKALIFPGEEDFGIVPVEVMASGRPVIAYGRGGALDSVVPGLTGELFSEQTVESVIAAVERFETGLGRTVQPDILRRHAEGFRPEIFRERMKTAINHAIDAKRKRHLGTLFDEAYRPVEAPRYDVYAA